MLVLLSPAKSMCSYRATHMVATCPAMLDRTDTLLNVMKGKTKGDIKAMMSISDDIAGLNYDRYQDFITNEGGGAERAVAEINAGSSSSSTGQLKVTSLVFDGPAYRGFDAASFTDRQYDHAQQHVRILSGLYGVLRPGDLIQEYRLEMGTKLPVESVKTLYEYWGDAITENLLNDLKSQGGGSGDNGDSNGEVCDKIVGKKGGKGKKNEKNDTNEKSEIDADSSGIIFGGGIGNGAGVGGIGGIGRIKVIVNCASQEYFKSIKLKTLISDDVRVIECVFKDKGRIASVYAKRARGLMARYIVTEGISVVIPPSAFITSFNSLIGSSSGSSGSSGDGKKKITGGKNKQSVNENGNNNNNDNNNENNGDNESILMFEYLLSRLRLFNLENYHFEATQSSDTCIVFNRMVVPPPVKREKMDDGVGAGEGEGGEEGGEEEVVKGKKTPAEKVAVKKEVVTAQKEVENVVKKVVKKEVEKEVENIVSTARRGKRKTPPVEEAEKRVELEKEVKTEGGIEGDEGMARSHLSRRVKSK